VPAALLGGEIALNTEARMKNQDYYLSSRFDNE
jgi:hypothetical protein